MVTFDYIKGKRQGQIRCESDLLESIRNHFSVKNDAAAFIKDPRKKRFIASRKYAITATGLFDFGLYDELRKYINTLQITQIEYTPNFINHKEVGFDRYEVKDHLKYDQRYYQKETVEQCLDKGRGTCVLATSAGKSLIQASLIENFIKHWEGEKFQCLLVVPGLSLVSQLSQDFDDYGVSFTHSMWTGDNPLDRTTDVVICNIENVTNAFTDNPWIVDVDLLIQDECHRVHGKTAPKKKDKPATKNVPITKLISKIKTPHKFGFTGTLSDQIMDKWKTLGAFGPIIYEKKSKELRDENYITDVNVTVIRLDHQRPRKMTYLQELDFIYESPERNNIIRKLSGNLKGNTLILVNHLKHGEALLEALSGIKKKVYFVKGEMKVSEREDIKKIMETDDDIVTIAMSSIFSTGINIKNIHNILFVAGGKSFIRTVQSIGRGLRLHDNKKVLTIIDVYDNLKYGERHVEERKTIYDMEQIPWREKIIKI